MLGFLFMVTIELTASQHRALKIIVKEFLDQIKTKDKKIYGLTKVLYEDLK